MMERKDQTERRAQDRTLPERFYSVDFLLKETGNVHQFKLRDMSSQGVGILVREDSEVLQHLKVGQELDMQYNPPKEDGPAEILKTLIQHITPRAPGASDGHFVIGLKIITRQDAHDT
jgi:hypothetical protein